MTDAPTAETADTTPGARPPLRRSREHKVVAGVCGGLGRCFDLDPVIFRVVLGVLSFTGGLGLIAYGFAWLLVPLEGEEENEGRRLLSGRVEGPALTAVLCALVGSGLFLSMLNNSGVVSFSLLLVCAVAGATYWSQQRRQAADSADETPATSGATVQKDAPPETKAPPAPGAPSWWRDPIVKDGVPGHSPAGTGYLWGPDYGAEDAKSASRGRKAAERAARRPARRGRPLGGWIFLWALAAAGLAIGVTWRHHPLGTSLEIGFACALGVFGLGITVSSLYGRTGGGTVVAAVVTGLLLTAAAGLPKSVTADWSRRTWSPSNASDVRSGYRLGSGYGTLDLTGVDWREDRTVATRAEVGAGKLRVAVPDDVTVKAKVDIGVGDVQLPGETSDDIDIKPDQHREVTLKPVNGKASRGTLEISLKVGLGQAEVIRERP
ncbi:PspC domain-containing protein [Streptomyces sp. NPDC050617]|uniref:PspC domain-containing protein n=1 Tax=Streptomyces sp. NPDC050617 TaxID=3154628 RepID=UPI00342D03BE